MSHSHEHHHDQSTYYMEQLCTLGVCGLLGGVAVMLYFQEMLRFFLADRFHIYVLWSGFGLLGLVAIRGAFLWSSVGRVGQAHNHDHCHHDSDPCDHDHDHEHEHEHEHALAAANHHHDHTDDCGHSHGWKPWRYIVLCLPVMLYFLNLPNQGFSSATALDVEESGRTVEGKGGDVLKLGFKEMEAWAYNENQRESFEGRKGRIKGQFVAKSEKSFTLVRFKMTCCAADAIPLRVAIFSPESVTHIKPMEWVEVTGQIQFRKRRDRDEYVPVLQLQSRNDVQPTEPDYNPFIQ